MAKTIKFNLMMDGAPVRTLEELRDHFNIEDLLEHYHSGLLHRWLTVRGLQAHSEKIGAISAKNDADIARQLITIFEMHGNQEQAQEIIRAIELKKVHQRLLVYLSGKHFKREEVINTYHQEYEDLLKSLTPDYFCISLKTYNALLSLNANFQKFTTLVDKRYGKLSELWQDMKNTVGENYFSAYKYQILQHLEKGGRKDFSFIKASIKHLVKAYHKLLAVDIIRFYNAFIEYEPLVIMAVLMHKEARNLFFDKPQINQQLSNLIDWNFLNLLPVKTFDEQTEGCWKAIEEAGMECMILRIESGSFVQHYSRGYGKISEELSAEKVNGKFPILNGIDYKGINANHKLVYLPCSEEHPFWKEPRK